MEGVSTHLQVTFHEFFDWKPFDYKFYKTKKIVSFPLRFNQKITQTLNI